MNETRSVQGVEVPVLMYGTAWKEDATAMLTAQAFAEGFLGVDTANQRKHYFEAAVGEALAKHDRARLFVQTKFTYRRGQDHRLPYDEGASPREQVRQSFLSSLEHLRTDYLDSYVLHGPSLRAGLNDIDLQTWAEMEALHGEGKTRLLGISNATREQLEALYATAKVKPAIVQNRTYANAGWDEDVRTFCSENGILFQGFSLLTANPQIVSHQIVRAIATKLKRTPEQIVFRFAFQRGMIALTGTTSAEHMRQDLAVFAFALDASDERAIAGL